MLASPEDVLEHSAISFIGLNPGGSEIDPAHAVFAPATGSSYLTERWAGYPPGCSPLQKQVRMLFDALAVEPERVLAGNLVPFRSRSWASLPDKQAAIAFGRSLWDEILTFTRPKLVVTMGTLVRPVVADLLGVSNFTYVPAGWGAVKICYAESQNTRVVGLPHLSRFTLMGRSQSQDVLSEAFGPFWKL